MKEVIVFKRNGEIRLATLTNPEERVCRKNLTDLGLCPKEKLECIPNKILEFCMETAPQYLYKNSKGAWESILDLSSV